MKTKYWLVLTFTLALISFFFGWVSSSVVEYKQMEDYDLYNCIYGNARINAFSENPIKIQRIQDECICFRENNYTDWLNMDCEFVNSKKTNINERGLK